MPSFSSPLPFPSLHHHHCHHCRRLCCCRHQRRRHHCCHRHHPLAVAVSTLLVVAISTPLPLLSLVSVPRLTCDAYPPLFVSVLLGFDSEKDLFTPNCQAQLNAIGARITLWALQSPYVAAAGWVFGTHGDTDPAHLEKVKKTRVLSVISLRLNRTKKTHTGAVS